MKIGLGATAALLLAIASPAAPFIFPAWRLISLDERPCATLSISFAPGTQPQTGTAWS